MNSITTRERTLFAIGLALSTIAGIMTFGAAPKFKEVFQSFGADLPAVTALSLQFYPALLALPLVVLAVWLAWPRKDKRGLAALVTGTAILLVAPLLLAAAMYLPVMRLGS